MGRSLLWAVFALCAATVFDGFSAETAGMRAAAVDDALPTSTQKQADGNSTTPAAAAGVRDRGREAATSATKPRPLILAHYLPWFAAPPHSRDWGWHWTMNRFDPEQQHDGRREIASHFYPLIGPYDTADADVIEYHLLLMKLAGIDGVIVDWYGTVDFNDYAMIHRHTQVVAAGARRLGLQFAVCYEDKTVPILERAGRIAAGQRIEHVRRELKWLAEHWFRQKNYVRLRERPLLLSFGQSGLTDAEWTAALQNVSDPPAYFSEHHRRCAAWGAYDWPQPPDGDAAVRRFLAEARRWPFAIPVVFPRFFDIYKQTGVHAGYERIADGDGATFRRTLDQAVRSAAPIIQIATWNDWGEGTMIEPSREFGYRELETLQAVRRRSDPTFVAQPADLRLPLRLLRRRRLTASRTPDRASEKSRLDRLAEQLAAGAFEQPRRELVGD